MVFESDFLSDPGQGRVSLKCGVSVLHKHIQFRGHRVLMVKIIFLGPKDH